MTSKSRKLKTENSRQNDFWLFGYCTTHLTRGSKDRTGSEEEQRKGKVAKETQYLGTNFPKAESSTPHANEVKLSDVLGQQGKKSLVFENWAIV